jgi:hypothetical protein
MIDLILFACIFLEKPRQAITYFSGAKVFLYQLPSVTK